MTDNMQQTTLQGEAKPFPLGTVQHDLANIKPTSSEISHLWSNYLAESMAVVMLKHMVAKSKDPDFHNVLQSALDISSQNIKGMEELFNTIQHPIPEAFGEKDVDINAPELYAEAYSVRYTKLMTKYILQDYSLAFSDSSRSDFKNLFSRFIEKAKELIEKADVVLLEKGLFPKSPYIAFPDRVEYVHDKSYYGSFLGRSKRPLNVLEISNIFNIMNYKMAMRALKLGFAQVTKSDKIRKHLRRGIDIADKQLEVLGSLLEKNSLPGPEFVDFQITDSKESPYSDRIMLFHTTVAMARIILVYGLALTNSARKDLVLALSRLMAEIMEFSKDGVDLLIENGWLERVPETANRQELIH